MSELELNQPSLVAPILCRFADPQLTYAVSSLENRSAPCMRTDGGGVEENGSPGEVLLDALRFCPASAGPFDLIFRFAGLRPAPMITGPPTSSSQSGQNHSPSGIASRGGSRHLRCQGLSHYMRVV